MSGFGSASSILTDIGETISGTLSEDYFKGGAADVYRSHRDLAAKQYAKVAETVTSLQSSLDDGQAKFEAAQSEIPKQEEIDAAQKEVDTQKAAMQAKNGLSPYSGFGGAGDYEAAVKALQDLQAKKQQIIDQLQADISPLTDAVTALGSDMDEFGKGMSRDIAGLKVSDAETLAAAEDDDSDEEDEDEDAGAGIDVGSGGGGGGGFGGGGGGFGGGGGGGGDFSDGDFGDEDFDDDDFDDEDEDGDGDEEEDGDDDKEVEQKKAEFKKALQQLLGAPEGQAPGATPASAATAPGGTKEGLGTINNTPLQGSPVTSLSAAAPAMAPAMPAAYGPGMAPAYGQPMPGAYGQPMPGAYGPGMPGAYGPGYGNYGPGYGNYAPGATLSSAQGMPVDYHPKSLSYSSAARSMTPDLVSDFLKDADKPHASLSNLLRDDKYRPIKDFFDEQANRKSQMPPSRENMPHSFLPQSPDAAKIAEGDKPATAADFDKLINRLTAKKEEIESMSIDDGGDDIEEIDDVIDDGGGGDFSSDDGGATTDYTEPADEDSTKTTPATPVVKPLPMTSNVPQAVPSSAPTMPVTAPGGPAAGAGKMGGMGMPMMPMMPPMGGAGARGGSEGTRIKTSDPDIDGRNAKNPPPIAAAYTTR